MIRERELGSLPGVPMAVLFFLVLCGLVYTLINTAPGASVAWVVLLSVAILVDVFLFIGLFVVNPNEGRVLQLFGDYVGTVKKPGLRWANPLYNKRRISQRVRNFESALQMLQERNVVELDGERRAAMVSNLLVVLCGHTVPQPVLNTGTLYT